MTKFKILALLSITLGIAGCATIFSGSTQAINIKVVDSDTQGMLDGARCTVTDGSGGTYSVGNNPGSVVVNRSSGTIQVNCKKIGYRQLNTAVGDSFNATTLVNILFWPGFLVDAMSGAYKKYPSHYVVSMERVRG